MKERIEKESLQSIVLDNSEVRWIKEGKEILIEGKLFDIKSSRQQDNNTVIFWGLFDIEETELEKSLYKKLDKNLAEQNQLLAQLFHYLQNIYFNPATDVCVLSGSTFSSGILSSPKLLTQFRVILTPPPQV